MLSVHGLSYITSIKLCSNFCTACIVQLFDKIRFGPICYTFTEVGDCSTIRNKIVSKAGV